MTLHDSHSHGETVDDKGDLLDQMFRIIRRRWRVLLVSTVGVLLLSLIQLSLSAPKYRITALMVENSDPVSAIRANQTTSSFSLLRGPTTSTEVDQFKALMTSPAFALRLENKYNFLRQIFPKRWDEQNQKWIPPHGFAEAVKSAISSIMNIPRSGTVDYYTLSSFIDGSITLVKQSESSVFQLSMRSTDPQFAEKFLRILVVELSEVVRNRIISEKEQYIHFLEQEISRVDVTSSRSAIISTLADQYRAVSIARSATTFPLQFIQEPMREAKLVNKSLPLSVLIGVLAGIFLGIIFILLTPHKNR